jgi:hypothetical protein
MNSQSKWTRDSRKRSASKRRCPDAMDWAVEFFIQPARAMQAAGCLVMVVAALVHFWCCDWRVSLPSQNGEDAVSDSHRIVGLIYPDESFPGNVWEACVMGVMVPGSLVLVGLFFLALADNRQAVSLLRCDETRRTSVLLVRFGQAGRLPCESTLRIPPTTTARPLRTRLGGPEEATRTDDSKRDTRQYVVCPLCSCFSIIQQRSPGRFIECPFCGRAFTLEVRQSRDASRRIIRVKGYNPMARPLDSQRQE